MSGIPAKIAQRKTRSWNPGPADKSPSRSTCTRSPSPTFSVDSQTIRISDDGSEEGQPQMDGLAVSVNRRTGAKVQSSSPPSGLFMIYMPGGADGEKRRLTPPSNTSRYRITDVHISTPEPDESHKTHEHREPPSSPGKIAVRDPCDSSSDSEPESERESWMSREFEEDEVQTTDVDSSHGRGYRSSVENMDEAQARNHMELRRKQVAQEILDTEDTHVNVLFNLTKDDALHLSCWRQGVNTKAIWKIDGANKKSPFIKETDFRRILPDIDPLYKVHCDHVRPALAKQLEEWGEDVGIASAFISIEPMLKMYRSYVPTMCIAAEKLTELRKTCDPLGNLLSILESEPGFGKLPVQAHMSSLFQRLLRYRLLLQKYTRYTQKRTEEKRLAQDALQRIEQIIESIENDMKSKENFAALFRVQGELEDGYAILDSERELIKEGEVTKIAARTGRKEMPRYLFLFNDIMLLCNPRNARGKYVVKAKLDVNGLKLRDALHLKRPDLPFEQTILLKARQSALTLMFKSRAERDRWETAFIRALGDDVTDNQLFMNTVNLGNALRIATNFKTAPTWIPDSSTDSCMLCNVRFSAIRRRHHCRGCGIVVDSKCLKGKIRLPFADHHEKKVCDECYQHARANYSSLVRNNTSRPDDDYV